MMQSRPARLLLVALVAGLLSVFVAVRWVQSSKGEQAAVVVLAADVPTGTAITAEMLRLAQLPKASLPAGTFATVQKGVGRVAMSTLIKGEPLIEARLAPEGAKAGLASMVGAGKRAMTVAVNDVVGVAGFALPGTSVDVLMHTRTDNVQQPGRGQPISKIVLENIKVLAVAQDVERNAVKPQGSNVVTLEVTPEQAESLDLARSVGTLSLVLRGQHEKEAVITMGATKDMVLGPAAAPTAAGPLDQLTGQVNGALKQAAAIAAAGNVAAVAPAAPRRVAKAPPKARSGSKDSCIDIIRGVEKVTECF